MNLIITNPLGFLALLGVPAVILIHFLQRQARVVTTPTLFLLAQTQRESVSGRRFDRLTNSIPLWLQLLMVLLLTWLLVEPRYINPATTQQVAVVVDSSASVSVFRDAAVTALRGKLPELKGTASRLQVYLFESDPERPTLYSGSDPEEAAEALAAASLTSGATDPTTALRLARSRISRDGILVYLTDHEREDLPFEAQLLAVGTAKSNCGFTGSSFAADGDTLVWRAIVRNYGSTPQNRTWQVEFPDGSRSEPKSLTLESGGMAEISAGFPADVSRLRVALEGDSFTLDDELPLVRPAPKRLNLWTNVSAKFSEFAAKFEASFPGLQATADDSGADLSLVTYDPLLPELPPGDSIVLVDETTRSSTYLSGGIVAEKHELMDGLNWQSLLVRESLQMELSASDEVLLWQGSRPLIALRTSAVFAEEGAEAPPRRVRQLIFNFDPTLSNAFKLPATVVLLHRFCADLRDRKVAPASLNTETGQPIQLAIRQGAQAAPLRFAQLDTSGSETEARIIPRDESLTLRAPASPGFFRISQGEEPLLESACAFADTREADLQACASADHVSPATGRAVEQNTREDHLWRVWILLTLLVLFLSWIFTKETEPAELVQS